MKGSSEIRKFRVTKLLILCGQGDNRRQEYGCSPKNQPSLSPRIWEPRLLSKIKCSVDPSYWVMWRIQFDAGAYFIPLKVRMFSYWSIRVTYISTFIVQDNFIVTNLEHISPTSDDWPWNWMLHASLLTHLVDERNVCTMCFTYLCYLLIVLHGYHVIQRHASF